MLQGLVRGLCLSSGKAATVWRSSIEQKSILKFQSIRTLSSSKKDDALHVEQTEDDDKHPRAKTIDFKQKIYLKDQFGRMLGLKTRQEADLIAKKNRLTLVEDDTTKKIPTLRLMNPRKIESMGEVLPESTGQLESDVEDQDKRSHKKISSKQLVFGSKLSDHDLITKIRHVKRWVVKNFETVIRIHSQKPEMSRMVCKIVLCFLKSNS